MQRVLKATVYSYRGFIAAYRNEEAFRQETWLALVMVPLGAYLGQTPIEQVLLVTTLLIVLLTELLNSAIEAAIDRISEDHHELSGRAKDIGSAAVFMSLFGTRENIRQRLLGPGMTALSLLTTTQEKKRSRFGRWPLSRRSSKR